MLDDMRVSPGPSAKTERHTAKSALHQMENLRWTSLEDCEADRTLDNSEPQNGRSMHSRSRTPRVNHPKGRIELTQRGTEKFWKSAWWKRRGSMKTSPNLAL